MRDDALETADDSPPRSRLADIRRALLVGVALAVLITIGRAMSDQIATATAWIESLGPAGPLVFILLYVVAVVAFVPGSLLTLAAGALFGIGYGTAYTLVAATLGAVAAFLVARYALRDLVERRLSASPRFAALDRAIAEDGRRIVFLLRLSPIFPFNALNYALGVTDVRFADFVLASVGMLPGTLLYVYYGKLAGDVTRVAGGVSPPRGPEYYALLALGLLATIAVTVYVTRAARRALSEATRD